MIPVRTNASNMKYKGDLVTGVEDVYVERTASGIIGITWKPDPEEVAAIAAGALVQLMILGEPIPPTMLAVSRRTELSAIATHLRDRAVEVLRLTFPGNPDVLPAGWWVVSEDVAIDLSTSGALDPNDARNPDLPPMLFGRPVTLDEAHVGKGKLWYQRAPELPEQPRLTIVRPS